MAASSKPSYQTIQGTGQQPVLGMVMMTVDTNNVAQPVGGAGGAPGIPVYAAANTPAQSQSTATAGAAKEVIAAGLAPAGFVFNNESLTNAMRVTWDGTDASSTHGQPVAPQTGISVPQAEAGTGKVSVYCVAADAYSFARFVPTA